MSRITSIRDGVSFFSSPAALRAPMVKAISAVQDAKPEEQILSLAAALVCLADAVGLNPHEIINRVYRAATDIDGPFAVHWQAMREYARGELLE